MTVDPAEGEMDPPGMAIPETTENAWTSIDREIIPMNEKKRNLRQFIILDYEIQIR